MMSAIKLDRLNYIEKTIEQEQQGYGEYYAFRATDDGMDILLNNEERIISLAQTISARPAKAGSFEIMADDIPF